MRHLCLALLAWALAVCALAQTAAGAAANNRIYRCGNEYTNNPVQAQARGCKLIEGGNITVVEGTKVSPTSATSGAGTAARGAGGAAAGGPRADSSEQRARDGERRSILEAELRKAELRQAELMKTYNNGEPEKIGIESRNHQRYLDRVAEMKAGIARNESDIAGLKREIAALAR